MKDFIDPDLKTKNTSAQFLINKVIIDEMIAAIATSPTFVTFTVTKEQPTVLTTAVNANEECVCSHVMLGIVEECSMAKHECICILGPEGTENCIAEIHLCSCREATPDTCQKADDHECCCREWNKRSCRAHYR